MGTRFATWALTLLCTATGMLAQTAGSPESGANGALSETGRDGLEELLSTIQARLAALGDPNPDADDAAASAASATARQRRSLENARTQATGALAARTTAERHREAVRLAPARLQAAQERLAAPVAFDRTAANLAIPDPPEDLIRDREAFLEDLERVQKATNRALDDFRTEDRALAAERERRRIRLADLPKEITQARDAVVTAGAVLPTDSSTDPVPPGLSEAYRLERRASEFAAREHLEQLETEKRLYEAESELKTAQRDVTQRAIDTLSAQADSLRVSVQAQREAQATADSNDAAAEAQVVTHPALAPIAAENARLATERKQLTDDVGVVVQELRRAETTRADLDARYAETLRRIQVADLTDAIGLQLRREKSLLPRERTYRDQIDARHTTIVDAQLRQIDIDEKRQELAREGDTALLRSIPDPGVIEDQAAIARRKNLLETGRELLATQREYLDALDRESKVYVNKLVALDTEQQLLVARIVEYETFIHERVLWIRSAKPIWNASPVALADSIAWFTQPTEWIDLAWAPLRALETQPLPMLGGLLLALVLIVSRRSLRKRIDAYGEKVTNPRMTRFAPTVATLVLTIAVGVGWPFLLWLVAEQAETATRTLRPFATAMARGIGYAAVLWAGLSILQVTLRPGGLGEAHFRWPQARTRLFRIHLRWLLPTALPAAAAIRALTFHNYAPWGSSLDQILTAGSLLVMTAFLWRTLEPRAPESIRPRPGEPAASKLAQQSRKVWVLVAVGAPIALAGLSLTGYQFTALGLLTRLEASFGVVFAAVLIYGLALRWMLLAKRRIALVQAKARLDAARAAREASPDTAAGTDAPPTQGLDDHVDLTAVDLQTRKLVRGALGALVILAFWAIWADELPALSLLDSIKVWEDTSGATPVPITLSAILLSLLTVVVTFAAARNIPGLLELAVMQRIATHAGERHAITTLVRYAIVTIGLLSAFAVIGIGWGKVQWLVAAISVGLGFGLQEIFANFVSGLIILFERPIRVGDLVTVGDVDGFVTRIHMRATTIIDYDRREMIVPNREFVTSRVVNWTLTDPVTRVLFPIGVAYGSDTDLVRQTLLETAKAFPLVLDEPAPSVVMLGFGDSSLDFEVRAFIASRETWPQLVDGLNRAIDKAFREKGLEIPFPQRDIHIRSGNAAFTVPGQPPQTPSGPLGNPPT